MNTAKTLESELLHPGPPLPSTVIGRLQALWHAFFVVCYLYLYGLPSAVLSQLNRALVQRKPLTLLSITAWRNAILAGGMPAILKGSDEANYALKRAIIHPFAHGRVLEIGAGTGMTVKYYDAQHVTELVLVEPFADLHAALRQTVAQTPALSGKTHIVPFGVEQRSQLERDGKIAPASFDTITLVQVMCSIGNPKEDIRYLQTLLKPGGQFLVFEHVGSKDSVSQTVQQCINPAWTRLLGGCNVNRHSLDLIASLGNWQSIDVQRPKTETSASLLPHLIGRFVKAT